MRIVIIETSRVSESTSIAHVRNSIALHGEFLRLGWHSILTDIHSEMPEGQFDLVLFSYACGFADFANVERLLDRQKSCKVGWITNEFELFANEFVKKRMQFIITNFVKPAVKKAHKSDVFHMANLNTLIAEPRRAEIPKKYGCCYYGTFRKYRQKYFGKYLIGDMILSTSKKNIRDFIDSGASCLLTDRFCWEKEKETLRLFSASLYIEDTKTHENFNYMANRFYEGLYCNAPCFFDSSCVGTIKKDAYFIDDYFIVDSPIEMEIKSKAIDREKREKYLQLNSEIALSERKKCVKSVCEFLSNQIN
jgi:hypothetical protein